MPSTNTKKQSRPATQVQSSTRHTTGTSAKMEQPIALPMTTVELHDPQTEDERGSGRLMPLLSQLTSGGNEADTSTPRPLRMMIMGSRQAVLNTIKILHYLRYAEATDWSKLQHGPTPGEFMSILTVRPSRLCL